MTASCARRASNPRRRPMRVDTLVRRPLASRQRVIMRILPGRWVIVPAALAGAGLAFTLGNVGIARADEPRNTTEPHVMQESGPK